MFKMSTNSISKLHYNNKELAEQIDICYGFNIITFQQLDILYCIRNFGESLIWST